MHHHVVGLEAIHVQYPEIVAQPPHTVTLTSYVNTSAEDLKDRVKDATIVITSVVKITAEILSPEVTPKLQAIAAMSTGTDHIDMKAAKARGILVFNCPHASADVVANSAIGLYFAARRRTVMMHNMVIREPSEWKEKGSIVKYMKTARGDAPLSCEDEICGIIGYGGIGKRIEALAKGLRMQVLLADRKANGQKKGSQGRIPFSEVLARSTVLMILVPKTPETLNLISTAELETMNPHAVIVNIARGGIVDESAIVTALKEGLIAGYATDVFEIEPAEGAKDSPLLAPDVQSLNLTFSPHAAWFGERTRHNLITMLKANIEAFIAGTPQNVVA
ncbi:uncharacterized protein PV09_06694 [Verruconis gallopava]|uniref:Glycerate dehydrogenase n=1 Tax=Verruconis gallopava TaxID=253628 RepID=A0A0D2A5L9_9PEZI|nr:uncharacterized protein PV09_06694 [Verruconis gallopava]KIW01845.1 hypothetical protein PV09_06694 [Verruconis gallopava]